MPRPHGRPPMALWAGPECSVVRIGDRYVDQLELTGHAARLDDLDRLAALGAEAVRYPVLWERTAPAGAARADWSWPDARLGRLRELGLRPIAGLVHHGSGPTDTGLLDERFPERLAEYARAVAERYPWVEDWTPVNEPLTTARFSCLYGHWYPHTRDDLSFVRSLVAQCRAVALAMAAIREVVPGARLVQTEDLGKTHATARLAYQADHENERRWLTWDLLCGRVGEEHPLWPWLLGTGLARAELDWLRERPCPPDVVGVNHYLSGERFLDERLARYPADATGGNGREPYADVLAARVLARGPDGPKALLRAAWERYRLPVAVTEAHNGCTREEQLRWLDEVWQGAVDLREEGADVRAVTLWSVFGAVGWDKLLVGGSARLETGVFDTSTGTPRPTALARLARGLASGRAERHPTLDAPPWWRRDARLWYEPAGAPRSERASGRAARRAPPLLIAGATGTLGRSLAAACDLRGLPYRLTSRAEVDVAEPRALARMLEGTAPWAVVNATGYVRVDDAERDAARCRRENACGPGVLAAACARRDIPLVTFSSDLVFDGLAGRHYVETDEPRPLSVYGDTKAEGERLALASHDGALVIRTSAFFGPRDEHNFVTVALRGLRAERPVVAADDLVVTPTYLPDLVDASLDLLIDAETGIWHLANAGAVTWADLARRAAEAAGVSAASLAPRPAVECGFVAPRPLAVPLASRRSALMPSLDDALTRYVAAAADDGRAAA